MRCPKCHADNPDDTIYCGKCATPLESAEEISITKTLVTLTERLQKGSTVAGRYKIIEELGRGGMGVVYKAEDIRLKRTVALKFLPSELTHVPDVKARFMREAQAAAALDHPNICTVYEFDEAEDKTFISMAYVEGRSLKKKLESGPLELEEALNIATQVAEGLQEAHKKGIIHRDIKSGNIMVTERGQAKIMDFGLARKTESTLITREGSAMGTVAYMSPEQAQGETVDHRTDIWSFGVVLYEMLTGKLPFKGDQEQAVLYSILKEDPESISNLRAGIPVPIEQVVYRALEKDPDKRYQQIEDLLDDLKSIAAGIVPEEIMARLRKARLRKRKRAFLYGGAAGLVIAAVVTALMLFTGPAEAIDSIAVLPLANLSGDPEQEYFADGMTEELITNLAKISALKVISRTSVMLYKGSKKPLPQIAKELNVDAVIEGSVLREGGQVRISAQLIRASTEQNLWAESYQRDLRGVLILQGEIASAIADKVRAAVTPTERARLARARAVNPEAHRLCLLGRFHWNKRTEEGFKKAIDHFQRAIEIDPAYAPAYAGLADSYILLSHWGFLPPKEAIPRGKAAAQRALDIDGSLAEAHASLAYAYFEYDWDWAACEREFNRAFELNPNYAMARHWHAEYLSAMRRHAEAVAEVQRAQQLDPLSMIIVVNVGMRYLWARQYQEAIRRLQDAVSLFPDVAAAHGHLGRAYEAKGMYQEAIVAYQKAMSLSGASAAEVEALGQAYAKGGIRGYYLWELGRLREESKHRYVGAVGFALFFAGLGEKDLAFSYLEKAYEDRNLGLNWLQVEPSFDPLRSDPRFQDLLRRMNFPPVAH